MSNNHKDHKTLNERVSAVKEQIIVGGKYRHYKNRHEYEVLDIALFSEDPEQIFVIYRGLYGQNLAWARPWEMWNEIVEIDDRKIPRFVKITNKRV
jgi:hypothetical protein